MLVVYDITNAESFDHVIHWLEDVKKYTGEGMGCHVTTEGCHVTTEGCHVTTEGCHVTTEGCHMTMEGVSRDHVCHMTDGARRGMDGNESIIGL